MKRVVFALFFTMALCSYALAAYTAPEYEDNNRVKFTLESQGTTAIYAISSIAWQSASGDEIGATGGFILEDSSGNDIASCEATAVSDQCMFVFTEPVIVNGMHVPHLDGNIYVYGKRK